MIEGAKFANSTIVLFLGVALFLGVVSEASTTKAALAEKRAEKRALMFGRRLQSLSRLNKNFTQVKKKPAVQNPVVAKLPVRLIRIQNLIEQGQMLMKAVPAALPVRGRISSSFGPRRHPRSQDYRIHTGIDIVAALGAPVVATADGRVVFSGVRVGYGKVIVIDHGHGYQTVYAHNSRLIVPVGSRVVRGQVISHVGRSGHTTGTHLHYEVRKNGEPIDPKPFLKRQKPAVS